jgi:predicted transcriptional regulator/transcriptional regulator with XRE-family HTH domain
MARILIGSKIRDKRKALGVTQAALAARLGISASYLNLIEKNRRNIGGSLLKRIAAELEVAIDLFDGAAERRLVDDLAELAGEAILKPLRLDPSRAGEFASAHRPWADALVTLQRAFHDRNETITALSDRLNQDPFLGDAIHIMLTNVAAIRSSSEILENIDELEPAQQKRFLAIIASESARLSEVAQALAAFFDRAHSSTRSVTPVEEVDDFLQDRENYFPLLEQAADTIRGAAGIAPGRVESTLVDYLQRKYSVQVVLETAHGRLAGNPHNSHNPHSYVSFDETSRTLTILETAPGATRRFELARLAARLGCGELVEAEIGRSTLLTTPAAARRAQRALFAYVAGAVLLPYDMFLEAALLVRYDIDYLCQKFGASFEQICHRLVTLRKPEKEGIRFGFMRSDPAGYVTKRLPLPYLALPRYGNACPLWAVYKAFQTPGATVRQLAEFPTGDRYLFLARAIEKHSPSFAAPRHLMSIMLACDPLQADRTVYGDGMDLSSAAPTTPVGATCRLCARRDCAYREEDPIIDA